MTAKRQSESSLDVNPTSFTLETIATSDGEDLDMRSGSHFETNGNSMDGNQERMRCGGLLVDFTDPILVHG